MSDQTKSLRKYGWKKDPKKFFDHPRFIANVTVKSLPTRMDLRPKCPPVYDQGELGSCTANALSGAFEFDQMKQKDKFFMPSRLFIYYNERVIEGDVSEDNGAIISDGVTTLTKQGVCPESEWPYDITKFAVKPTAQCYADGLKHVGKDHRRIMQDLNQMKQILANGTPFVFGFTVYESFESDAVAATGVMPMPKPGEQELGGHAVMCVGYDDVKKSFIVRNSWGTGWGDKGYFYMPYAYMLRPDLASDFWAIINVIDK